MSDISKIKVSGVEYGIKDIQAREDLGNLGNRVSAIEVKEAGWNSKYSKPTGGIPKTDLANDVQASLGKAETALQEHQSLAAYRTSAAQDIIDNTKQDKLIAGDNITIAADGKTISATGGVQSDWNQNDSTAADYVKNRPFYTGSPVETVLVEESTVPFEDDGGKYFGQLGSTFSATVGDTYKVSWDGTTYECACVDFSGMTVIGNLFIVGAGSDTGEPFIMTVDNGIALGIYTADTASSHTISISGAVAQVVKIDEKYLPELPHMDKVNPTGTGAFSLNRKADTTIGNYSFAEGIDTTASGYASHAEGVDTTASGVASHAEGSGTTASGEDSHAEGLDTTASGYFSHAEGSSTTASGDASHAEGVDTTASGVASHAEGYVTKASSDYQHVHGKYNIEDTSNTYAEIVGNGDSLENSNAYTLDWSGNAWYAGTVEGKALILPSSTTDSTKKFKITVDDSGTISATEVTA